jgi:hypothetical protein
MIYWSLSVVVSCFGVFSDVSFLIELKEFDLRRWRFIFVFFTTFAFFGLDLAAAIFMMLAGSCLKLRVEGNFFNWKLVTDSCFFSKSKRWVWELYLCEDGALSSFCACIKTCVAAISNGISDDSFLSERRPRSTRILPFPSLATFLGVSSL